jgi:hypothetical protein
MIKVASVVQREHPDVRSRKHSAEFDQRDSAPASDITRPGGSTSVRKEWRRVRAVASGSIDSVERFRSCGTEKKIHSCETRLADGTMSFAVPSNVREFVPTAGGVEMARAPFRRKFWRSHHGT